MAYPYQRTSKFCSLKCKGLASRGKHPSEDIKLKRITALKEKYKDRYVERHCINCGKPFIIRSKIQQKYCNRECFQTAWPMMITKACLICGIPYHATSAGQKYCKDCGKIHKRDYHRQFLRNYKTLLRYRFHNEQQESKPKIESKANSIFFKRSLKRVIQTRESVRRWRHRHPEEHRRRNAKWRKENKDKVNFMNRRREHMIKGATGYLTWDEWNEIKAKFNFTCPRCGRREPDIKLTIDHIIPISMGGTNNKENIQPLCGQCN
ncbi:HNH endonuclease [Candidatus Bathyarchaeota archaeon]|nr:HNH endonuclease [Candidatus Bathyarchaeota archaeon]